MSAPKHYYAETAMLIRRPPAEVFNAFTDPEVTTKFWFTKSTGKLEEGKDVHWTWEMYGLTLPVHVKTIVPRKQITIQWSDDPDNIVNWDFEAYGDGYTFVTITNHGFTGTTDELIARISDSATGFTWVLAGLKAYLEHNIQLNLTADRHPDKIVSGK